jgi:UDP-3-O-[3-hydroxymyristoyl] glucosamine N-acyltransferase
MIAGHLELADGTVVSACSALFESVASPGIYTGTFPALPHRDWRHVASAMRRLRSIVERIRTLERAATKEEI